MDFFSRYDQATCFMTEAVINAFNAKRAKFNEAIENHDKKQDDIDTTSVKLTPDEVKLYDALACVVLSTKNSRQPWALEMLVKVLRQVMTTKNSSTMFKSACHADLKNILPEMAQLQWTLHGNAGIKMISSCPSCQFLGEIFFFIYLLGVLFLNVVFANCLKVSKERSFDDINLFYEYLCLLHISNSMHLTLGRI